MDLIKRNNRVCFFKERKKNIYYRELYQEIVLYLDINSFILMNRDKYIDLYIYILKVKWFIDKCFYIRVSKIFKFKG